MSDSDLQFVQGYWWPKRIKPACFAYSFKFVKQADFAINLARPGNAIQAGGNIGLWPLAMARSGKFKMVSTFEPEPVVFECLSRNVGKSRNIQCWPQALGEKRGKCDIKKRSLASHRVTAGDTVDVVKIDAGAFANVSLIQLDLEGYEYRALLGARETIQRCKPVLQIELGGLGIKNGFGDSDESILRLLKVWGYREVKRLGRDVVFQHA